MRGLVWVLVTAGWVVPAGAQSGLTRPPVQGTLVDGPAPYATPAATAEGVLEDMSARAAVIFAGRVAAVRMPGDRDAAGNVIAGAVQVEFVVEQGVRGVADGATYTVREWEGLWRDGARYQVGQRRLMLLHAPGPSGLSSPVDGTDGAVPIVGGGVQALGTAMTGTALVVGSVVDMRWLQARTLRPVAYGADVVSGTSAGETVGLRPVAATVGRVMGLLAGWEAVRHAR